MLGFNLDVWDYLTFAAFFVLGAATIVLCLTLLHIIR